jgi:hypothetical protein
MRYDTLEPYIINAADNFIIPHLGLEFYGEMVTYSQLATNLQTNAIKNNLLRYLRTALANYTIYQAMPTLNIILSDAGVQQNRTDKSSNSPQWAYNQARWSCLLTAEKSLDNAINYMYANKNETIFDNWVISDGFKHMFTDFIGGLGNISNISPIRSIRAYQALIPFMRNAENQVRNLCGQRQYDDIKTKLTDTDTRYKQLIEYIRKYTVDFALMYAIPVLSLYNNGKDLVLIGDTDGIGNEIGINAKSHQETINIMLENLTNSSKAQYQEIKNYLAIHKDFFVLYGEDTHQDYRSKSVYVSTDINGDVVGGVMM